MKDYTDKIGEALNQVLADIYSELGISTGDITPLQSFHLDSLIADVNKLFNDLIDQNKEV